MEGEGKREGGKEGGGRREESQHRRSLMYSQPHLQCEAWEMLDIEMPLTLLVVCTQIETTSHGPTLHDCFIHSSKVKTVFGEDQGTN